MYRLLIPLALAVVITITYVNTYLPPAERYVILSNGTMLMPPVNITLQQYWYVVVRGYCVETNASYPSYYSSYGAWAYAQGVVQKQLFFIGNYAHMPVVIYCNQACWVAVSPC